MTDTWLVTTLVALPLGAGIAPVLAARGLHQLAGPHRATTSFVAVTSLAGAAAVTAAVEAAQRADSPGWWLLALVVWALTIAAAAACDARTQRVPTPLVRTGGCLVGALAVMAGVVTHDWRGLLATFLAGAASGAILGVCWRFAGAGFGDVRLAAVGGLGLGHISHRALVLAVLTFMLLTMAHATWTYARTRDRKARFAYGPALVVGFLVAAAV